MTAVAVKKYNTGSIEMAADTQVLSGELKQPFNQKKIFEINNFLIGSAGSLEVCQLFNIFIGKQIIKDIQCHNPHNSMEAEYVNLLWEFHSKYGIGLEEEYALATIYVDGANKKIYSSIGINVFEIEEFYAIGRGRETAFGALEMGATPQEAVKAACKYIDSCSEPVNCIKIPKK